MEYMFKRDHEHTPKGHRCIMADMFRRDRIATAESRCIYPEGTPMTIVMSLESEETDKSERVIGQELRNPFLPYVSKSKLSF